MTITVDADHEMTLDKRNLLSRGYFVWYRNQRLGHVVRQDGAWQAYNNSHRAQGLPQRTEQEAALVLRNKVLH